MLHSNTRQRSIGLLCALLATMCWASNYTVVRYFFNGINAGNVEELWMIWLRLPLGIGVLLPFTLMKKSGSWGDFKKQWKEDWKIFALIAACTVSEGALGFLAMKYTTGARASLMANMSPVFTIVISVLAGREILNRRKTAGIFLGMVGILLAAFSRGGDIFSGGNSMLGGDLLALTSGIFWALFTVFGGMVSSRYNGAFCTVLYRLGGMIYLLPVLLICNTVMTFDLPGKVWIFLLYLAAVPGGIAVWLWSIAQKYVEPGVLGAFGYLSAFCATAFSVFFLQERLSLQFIIAFILILGGMGLAIRNRR